MLSQVICSSVYRGRERDNIRSIPRKVQANVLGPLRTLVTDHCMLHWFCALVA